MSQGYKLSLNIGGGGGDIQFQNVSARIASDELDTSSSLNSDLSFNEGFSDTDGDLGTIFVEVDSIIKDTRAASLVYSLPSGFRYPTTTFELDYNSGMINVTGTGIYVQENRMTFNIPGAARVFLTFRSLQSGYEINL